MEKKSNILLLLGYLYVVLPILIFVIGWCNVWTAILGTVVILASGYFLYKNAPKLWLPSSKKDIFLLVSIFVITLVWVYSSGIGALVFQNSDHNCRNPIFELLVTQPWPVDSENGLAILTYYIGFWMPAALIGKIFNSVQLGYYFQILWATIGIFLFFYYVLATLKHKNIVPVLIFIFFSGLDVIGAYLTRGLYASFLNPTTHMEWWYPGFQFSSMTTQLYWVFNQAIPAWIILMLLYHQKNNKNIIFLYSCMLLHSTLPAIGMLPFVVYWGLKNGLPDGENIFLPRNVLSAIKSCLTFENILGGGLIATVSYLYLSNNVSGGSSGWIIPLPHIWMFHFLEWGIFVLCIWRYVKNRAVLKIACLMLIICPLIIIGHSADFCMRATIPALTVVYLCVVQVLDDKTIFNNKKTSIILILTLILGAFTPIHEMTRTIVKTRQGVTKAAPKLSFDNFYGWKQGNMFLELVGKVRK